MAKTKRVHKRRKVWVNDRDGVLSGTCEETRSDAEMLSGRPVPFLESRPGDVVLSREDVARAQRLLDEASSAFRSVKSKLELRALLRGGR